MTQATISKKIRIIAGPNGAGKTTFATEFLPNEADSLTFVNADMIASGLNPFQPERAAVQAGRLMLRMVDSYVKRGETFAIDTTLSGRSYARLIPTWQAQGYIIQLYFLRLPSPEMAVERVRLRVSQGGHNIPKDVVHRRFHAGWHNFQQIYRDIVDEWALHNSSETSPTRIEQGRKAMNKPDHENGKSAKRPLSADFIGAEKALRRAAAKARKRAIETTGSIPTWRDGNIVYDTEV